MSLLAFLPGPTSPCKASTNFVPNVISFFYPSFLLSTYHIPVKVVHDFWDPKREIYVAKWSLFLDIVIHM